MMRSYCVRPCTFYPRLCEVGFHYLIKYEKNSAFESEIIIAVFVVFAMETRIPCPKKL